MPKGTNTSFSQDWESVIYVPLKFSHWPDYKITDPRIVYRGTIHDNNKTYPLYTVHYRKGYLNPPPGKAGSTIGPRFNNNF